MEKKLSREELWANKKTMAEFLKEPLNKKLYDVYMGIKKNAPLQDFHTLGLFNEVYYQCSRIIIENNRDLNLSSVISEIKENLGWDYSSSIVVNMIYAVLSLRHGNTEEINDVLYKIKKHYLFEQRHPPFYEMSEACKAKGEFYDFDPIPTTLSDAPIVQIPMPIVNPQNSGSINIYLNLNNQFTGEIKAVNVNSPGNCIANKITKE